MVASELVLWFASVALEGLLLACGWTSGWFRKYPIALRKIINQAGGLSDQLRSLLELASKLDPAVQVRAIS